MKTKKNTLHYNILFTFSFCFCVEVSLPLGVTQGYVLRPKRFSLSLLHSKFFISFEHTWTVQQKVLIGPFPAKNVVN